MGARETIATVLQDGGDCIELEDGTTERKIMIVAPKNRKRTYFIAETSQLRMAGIVEDTIAVARLFQWCVDFGIEFPTEGVVLG